MAAVFSDVFSNIYLHEVFHQRVGEGRLGYSYNTWSVLGFSCMTGAEDL